MRDQQRLHAARYSECRPTANSTRERDFFYGRESMHSLYLCHGGNFLSDEREDEGFRHRWFGLVWFGLVWFGLALLSLVYSQVKSRSLSDFRDHFFRNRPLNVVSCSEQKITRKRTLWAPFTPGGRNVFWTIESGEAGRSHFRDHFPEIDL